MDKSYIDIIVNAMVAFFQNFKVNDIAVAYAAINFDGLKNAFLTIFETLRKVMN